MINMWENDEKKTRNIYCKIEQQWKKSPWVWQLMSQSSTDNTDMPELIN